MTERNMNVLELLLTDGVYSWLNLILLGWTVGLVWVICRVLCWKGTIAQKLRRGMENEEFLFGNWSSELRTRLGGWLFLVAVVLLQFDMFFMNSLIREFDAPWHNFLESLMELLYFGSIVIKLIFFTRYSGWQLGVSWCFFFVSRWVFLNNHDFWVIVGIIFALAAKDAPLRRTLKAGLAVSATSFLVVVLGSAVRLVPTVSEVWNNGRERNSFGYGWFNLTGAILLGICIMYLCWRQAKNLKWFDIALLAGAMVFCDIGPDSRAATVCIALLVVLMCILRFFPKVAEPIWVCVLTSAVPVLALAASLISAWFYQGENPFWAMLDLLTTGRIKLGHQALTGSTFAIAGQGAWNTDFVVDNFYLSLWIFGGPVMSLLFWGAITLLLWRLMKKGAVTESACLLVMLAHATMEPHLIWPCINVTLWLLPCVLYLLPAEYTPDFAL